MKKVNTYYIYGLKTSVENNFFYIGITQSTLSDRLSMHISGIKCGIDTNKEKCKIFVDNDFNITPVLITEYEGTKKDSLKEENKYIHKYLTEGHPLTNRIAKGEETKCIRIDKYYHGEVRRYLAEKGYDGENIKSFVDAAIFDALKRGSHIFSDKKSKSSKK